MLTKLSFPPHYHLSLIIHQLQRRLPSVLSLSASAMSSSEGVTGSEFVLRCSGSLQGKGERCKKGSHRNVPNLPLPSAGSSSPNHVTPTHLQAGSITTRITQSSLLKWKFSTFQGARSPFLQQLQIFQEESGTQRGLGLPSRPQTLSLGTGWPLGKKRQAISFPHSI